jgi:hypothetical protein
MSTVGLMAMKIKVIPQKADVLEEGRTTDGRPSFAFGA